jgi:hypothetical protein
VEPVGVAKGHDNGFLEDSDAGFENGFSTAQVNPLAPEFSFKF